MSGDLEDFLRRAAQRRQAKAAQQQNAPAQQRRARPQYSNSRTERVVQPADDHDIPVAELVEDDPNSLAARRKRLEQSRKAAEVAQAEAAKKAKAIKGTPKSTSAASIPMSGNAAENLLQMLRQPGGIQQAILLREILDRPEHRW